MRDLELSGISRDLRRSPAKWSQEPLVGGPLPTRHGQDDGSLTNSLKLASLACLVPQRGAETLLNLIWFFGEGPGARSRSTQKIWYSTLTAMMF